MKKQLPNSEILIDVENVSKKYCRQLHRSLRYGVADLLRESFRLEASPQTRPGEFYALRDVSFQVRRGESLAIVGPNGAGKSSMLKILNGVIKPTKGSVRMHGRVAALTTLGAGFNPILSGRENAYINASVFGFTDEEMDSRYEAMLDFSELGEAINDPVKTYSSGMKARLGFSIGAFLEPDVLLMDEVLATGDRKFRQKCFAHFDTLLERGTSIVIVSHVVSRVCQMCHSALVLKGGQVFFHGPGPDGYEKYYEALGMESPKAHNQRRRAEAKALKAAKAKPTVPSPEPLTREETVPPARLTQVQLTNVFGKPIDIVRKRRNVRLRITIDSDKDRDDLRLAVQILSQKSPIARLSTKPGELSLQRDCPKTIELFLRTGQVLIGNFNVSIRLTGSKTDEVFDAKEIPVEIQRRGRKGMLLLNHSFQEVSPDTEAADALNDSPRESVEQAPTRD